MGNVQMEADQIRYKDSSGAYRNVQAGLAAAIAGGGGSGTLAGLTDTDITTPSNGQVLTYDATAEKWENETPASGVTTLAALTDTAITTPSNGQVLTYDSASSKWVNAAGGSGGGGEVYPVVGTEVKIGTWAGADLYRQVYAHSISGASPNVIDLGIPDTYTVRKISGTNVRAGATYALPYYSAASNFVALYTASDSGNLKANVAFSGSFSGDTTIFVDYTKPVTP